MSAGLNCSLIYRQLFFPINKLVLFLMVSYLSTRKTKVTESHPSQHPVRWTRAYFKLQGYSGRRFEIHTEYNALVKESYTVNSYLRNSYFSKMTPPLVEQPFSFIYLFIYYRFINAQASAIRPIFYIPFQNPHTWFIVHT